MLPRLLAFLLLLAPAAAHAQEERIRDFASDIQVARNGDLTVTETIRIAVANRQINHGINRDFPTSYRNPLGQRTRVGFELLSVARDGRDEPYELANLVNGERIRIGSAEVTLTPGDHTYVIRYRTTRQLVFADGYDEVYWNVTGTGWTFPIDMASARITLPAAASFGKRHVYTGAQGATGEAATVVDEAPGTIAFRTTAPLGVGEGLTVAAAFPKGVVTAPPARSRLWWWLQDWASLAAGVLATLGLIAFQLRAWLAVGRGPRAGPVVPLFAPPEGLSAAATRYVARMGMDNRVFTAAIVESGVKRQLRIDKQDGGWFARDTTTLGRTDGGQPLPPPERQMLAQLFPDDAATLELKQDNHAILQAARSALGTALDKAYLGTTYAKNTAWAVVGLLAVPVAVFAIAIVASLVGDATPGIGFAAPLFGLATVGGVLLAWRLAQGRSGCLAVLAWLLVAGCAIATTFAVFVSLITGIAQGGWAALLPVATLPVALFAFKWMKAPTPAGRATMDRIAGFRHYLGIVEEDRLNALHPPDKTPELFERYLPYAIALDVENRWAERFAGVLAAAAAAGAGAATLGWYSGDGDLWTDPGGFASSVGDTLDSSVASASASPSSSGGGSGGGGSSGGGGGGGGGSGW